MNPLTYAPRLVQAFPTLNVCGRALKPYGIFAVPERRSAFPPPERLHAQVASVLCEPLGRGDHGAGFLMLHFAMDGDYLLVSQWYDANNLKHRVYAAETGARGDTAFVPLAQRDVIACVWELEVVKFERDAWVRTVLARGALDRSSLDAYLGMTFSGWV